MKPIHYILICCLLGLVGCSKKFSCECTERKPGEDTEYSIISVTGRLSIGHSGYDEEAEQECEKLEIHSYPHTKLCNLK